MCELHQTVSLIFCKWNSFGLNKYMLYSKQNLKSHIKSRQRKKEKVLIKTRLDTQLEISTD